MGDNTVTQTYTFSPTGYANLYLRGNRVMVIVVVVVIVILRRKPYAQDHD
ncbi:MAG: hypothetical protein QXR44_00030 [Thermoproteota archaeon]